MASKCDEDFSNQIAEFTDLRVFRIISEILSEVILRRTLVFPSFDFLAQHGDATQYSYTVM